jgi:vacuolar iron transporter family protein
MAVSNYQGTKSQLERVEEDSLSEERQIEEIPAGAREEVRQIFAANGFSGETLERIVEGIASDFGVGAAKGFVAGRSPLRSGVGTLLTGGAAAAIAFVVGALLRNLFGAA